MNFWHRLVALFLVLGLSTCVWAAAAPDLVIADFEGADYGQWKASGTAFGPGPAHGAFPGQQNVTGFVGRGLVNSYCGGDNATGTLTSPSFTIERRHINFLIGAGGFDTLAMNLLVDGKVVRTARGSRTRPGGTEELAWASWDVSDLVGKQAIIEIVDAAKGGWGHINVDQITQSDVEKADRVWSRTMVIERPYLLLPVSDPGATRRATFKVHGQTVREFDIPLADGTPAYWVFADVTAFKGQPLTIEWMGLTGSALDAVVQSDKLPGPEQAYSEPARPQFHFTTRCGWINDPNGMVYDGKVWHLFYQHNPYFRDWGNMHWGHAISPDLVHWKQLPVAIYPHYEDWAFSGSAIMDTRNTSGFGKGGVVPLVAAFTSTGRGECIVYSLDSGLTFTEFAGNPVLQHNGRDPRLLWHAPTKQWVMVVYDANKNDEDEKGHSYAFYTSSDLKAWTYCSRVMGFYECPDLFELPVLGRPGEARWVLHGADGRYLLGRFDGKTFTPEGPKQQTCYGATYAAQTFSNAPAGRVIQIAWNTGVSFGKEVGFTQQMSVPRELALRANAGGVSLYAYPVSELDALHRNTQHWTGVPLGKGENPLAGFKSPQADIFAEIAVSNARAITLKLRGATVTWDAAGQQLRCGQASLPLAAVGGKLRLRVLVDTGSVEIFGNDGQLCYTAAILHPLNDLSYGIQSDGDATAVSLQASEMNSIWRE